MSKTLKSCLGEPEISLLLSCSRTRIDQVASDRIHFLASQVKDWDLFLTLCNRNRLAALTYHNLSNLCSKPSPGDGSRAAGTYVSTPIGAQETENRSQNRYTEQPYREASAFPGSSTASSALPPQIFESLRQSAQEQSANSLFFAGELLRVLGALKHTRVDAAPYKGLVTGALAYGNIAFRPFSDLDILIGPNHLGAATATLIEEGYLPDCKLTSAQENAMVWAENELSFFHPGKEVLIELHWRFTGRHYYLGIPEAELWQRMKPFTLLGRNLETLSPEDLILLMCVSGAGHGWSHLNWVADIAESINANPALDWSYLLRQAKRFKCRRMVRLGLSLASLLLDAPLPPFIIEFIDGDRRIQGLVDWVCEGVFSREGRPYRAIPQTRFYIVASDSPLRGLSFCLRNSLLPTSRDIAAISLPKALFGLYFLVRPIRLIAKLTQSVAARLFVERKPPAVSNSECG